MFFKWQAHRFYAEANMLLHSYRYCSNETKGMLYLNCFASIGIVAHIGLTLHLSVLIKWNVVTAVFYVVFCECFVVSIKWL